MAAPPPLRLVLVLALSVVIGASPTARADDISQAFELASADRANLAAMASSLLGPTLEEASPDAAELERVLGALATFELNLRKARLLAVAQARAAGLARPHRTDAAGERQSATLAAAQQQIVELTAERDHAQRQLADNLRAAQRQRDEAKRVLARYDCPCPRSR